MWRKLRKWFLLPESGYAQYGWHFPKRPYHLLGWTVEAQRLQWISSPLDEFQKVATDVPAPLKAVDTPVGFTLLGTYLLKDWRKENSNHCCVVYRVAPSVQPQAAQAYRQSILNAGFQEFLLYPRPGFEPEPRHFFQPETRWLIAFHFWEKTDLFFVEGGPFTANPQGDALSNATCPSLSRPVGLEWRWVPGHHDIRVWTGSTNLAALISDWTVQAAQQGWTVQMLGQSEIYAALEFRRHECLACLMVFQYGPDEWLAQVVEVLPRVTEQV